MTFSTGYPQGVTPTSWSQATGVQGGQQAGFAFVGGFSHASLWSGTAASWVDLHPAVTANSYALGVDGGEQVGYASVGGFFHASLWTGTAASWVDLHPAAATRSSGHGVGGGQQVGFARVRGASHASLWSGTAASWVDLHPAGAWASGAVGVDGGQQVGSAVVGSGEYASLWSGTAASWVNLHAFVPQIIRASWARGIWHEGASSIVVGAGVNRVTGDIEALMWLQLLPCTGICGDCNLNALGPDILDALTATQIEAGLIVLTPKQMACCDVNSSSAIDVLDALLIAQCAVGLGVALVCP